MTPIERAGRALALSDSGVDCWDALDPAMQAKLIESARAVLGAVREPSEAMTEAADNADALSWSPEEGEGLDFVYWPKAWQAMIDAALSE